MLKFLSNSSFVCYLILSELYCHMYANALSSQKRVPDPLELELQVLVRCLVAWVLGTWSCLEEQQALVSISPAFSFWDDCRLTQTCDVEIPSASLHQALHKNNILHSWSTVSHPGYRFWCSIKTHFYFIGFCSCPQKTIPLLFNPFLL